MKRAAAANYFGQKIDETAATCNLIEKLPLPVDARIARLGSKGIPKSCFGSELVAPTQYLLQKLSHAHMNAMFGTSRSFRNVGATMVLCIPGPRVDPRQAVLSEPLFSLRRLLKANVGLRDLFRQVWQWRCHGVKGWVKKGSPTNRVQQILNALQWDWFQDAFVFARPSGCSLDLLGQQDGWFKHEIRDAVRQSRWIAMAKFHNQAPESYNKSSHPGSV